MRAWIGSSMGFELVQVRGLFLEVVVLCNARVFSSKQIT
jgi:hypothetical protein